MKTRNRTSRPVKGNSVRGDGQDYGRYVKCKNCGFTVDTTKASTGQGFGVAAVLYSKTAYPPITSVRAEDNFNFAALKDNSSPHYAYKPEITGGCPFCGSKNYK